MTPTKPGKYWYRQDAEHPWVAVKVVGLGICGCGSWLFAMPIVQDSYPRPIDRISGEWTGMATAPVGAEAADGYAV
jgi:hypothetical protein